MLQAKLDLVYVLGKKSFFPSEEYKSGIVFLLMNTLLLFTLLRLGLEVCGSGAPPSSYTAVVVPWLHIQDVNLACRFV